MPTIRPAQLRDIAAITEIYNKVGIATTASYALEPVTVEQRQEWFSQVSAAGFPVLVLEHDNTILGFASYGPFRNLGGYAHTVEHSVYVADGHRSAGGGRMLMNALVDYARGRGVHVMVGVVDASNADSIAFHRKIGFVECGRLPQVGRKFGRWLDVVFLALVFESAETEGS